MNVVVVAGTVTRDSQSRALPSGDEVVSFDVSVPREEERNEVVPVAWIVSAEKARDFDADEQVVVVGRVRKRFYQSAVGLQSRTEVFAERVLTSKSKKSLTKTLHAVYDELKTLEAA